MKMIANNIGTISMAKVVKEALFGSGKTATNCLFDVYAEDDGTIRVYKHKISFNEAESIAIGWLNENKVRCNIANKLTYTTPFFDVVVCTYIPRGSNNVKLGLAKCSGKDKYSYVIGKALAYSRASGKKLPDELANYLGIKQ